eukprot:COSAG06_NODE_63371_length_262_cov_0.950920_1_plen_28_part_10
MEVRRLVRNVDSIEPEARWTTQLDLASR